MLWKTKANTNVSTLAWGTNGIMSIYIQENTVEDQTQYLSWYENKIPCCIVHRNLQWRTKANTNIDTKNEVLCESNSISIYRVKDKSSKLHKVKSEQLLKEPKRKTLAHNTKTDKDYSQREHIPISPKESSKLWSQHFL